MYCCASSNYAIRVNDHPGNVGPRLVTPTIRAAEYTWMSTAHQQYFIEDQGEAIPQ